MHNPIAIYIFFHKNICKGTPRLCALTHNLTRKRSERGSDPFFNGFSFLKIKHCLMSASHNVRQHIIKSLLVAGGYWNPLCKYQVLRKGNQRSLRSLKWLPMQVRRTSGKERGWEMISKEWGSPGVMGNWRRQREKRKGLRRKGGGLPKLVCRRQDFLDWILTTF